ncbi:MAG TPA: DUF4136 domain-containing protein [Planctomycetota bacterium]|nr:DUF4136 domain-containing protein [Planctomycetota bacterium]
MRFLPLALLAACSSVSTNYDYDMSYDFSKLRTYRWADIPSKADADPLVVQRVGSAVEAELKAKGYAMAEGTPDFLVANYVGKHTKIQVNDWGYGYGPHGRWYGGGGLDVYEYEQGSLIVDVVDATTRQLVWRGTATAIVDPSSTPEEKTERIKEAVAKMFEDFPPKKK